MVKKPSHEKLEKRIQEFEQKGFYYKGVEEALEKRIVALIRPFVTPT